MADMLMLIPPNPMTIGTKLMAIALLAESHTSVHLDLSEMSLHADLFSCKPFDLDAYAKLTQDTFRLKQYRRIFEPRSLFSAPPVHLVGGR